MKRDPKKDPPPAGIEVIVHGSDYMGDFWQRATRVDYKQKPNCSCFKSGDTYWRFVRLDGVRLDQGDCESWEHEARVAS